MHQIGTPESYVINNSKCFHFKQLYSVTIHYHYQYYLLSVPTFYVCNKPQTTKDYDGGSFVGILILCFFTRFHCCSSYRDVDCKVFVVSVVIMNWLARPSWSYQPAPADQTVTLLSKLYHILSLWLFILQFETFLYSLLVFLSWQPLCVYSKEMWREHTTSLSHAFHNRKPTILTSAVFTLAFCLMYNVIVRFST